MKLVRRFLLRDIRNYERDNNVNLIEYFNDPYNLCNLIELIKIGNNTDDKGACELLDEYLSADEGNNLITAYQTIRDTLLGKQVRQGDNTNIVVKKYDSLTDVFNELCKQALSNDISYSEFWDMDTKEIYTVMDGMVERHIQKTNEKLSEYHLLAGMVGAAVWGKLKSRPPHIDDEALHDDDLIYVEEFGTEMTMAQYRQIQAIQGMDNKH